MLYLTSSRAIWATHQWDKWGENSILYTATIFLGGGGRKYFFSSPSHCLPFRELSEMNKIYADFFEEPHNSSSHEKVAGPKGYKGGSIILL